MAHASIPPRILKYCRKHGFIEPFLQDQTWWAFPIDGVIPVALPIQVWDEDKVIATAQTSVAFTWLACSLIWIAFWIIFPGFKSSFLGELLVGIQAFYVVFLLYLHVDSRGSRRFSKFFSILVTSSTLTLLLIASAFGVFKFNIFSLGALGGSLAAGFTFLSRHYYKYHRH